MEKAVLMNYRERLLIATVSILLLTIIVTGCEERDLIKGIGAAFQSKTNEKVSSSENTSPPNVVSPDKFLDQDKKMLNTSELEASREIVDIDKIILTELMQRFPKYVRFGETDQYIYQLDTEKMEEYGTYFWDSNATKYVFLMDQEDSEVMKEIRRNLEEAMGDYIEFRKSKFSQLQLKNAENEIQKILEGKKIIGGWSVTAYVMKEKVDVVAYIDETTKAEIIQKYGADMLDVHIPGTGVGLVGYVIDKKGDKILVANPHKQQNELRYPATWFSNAPSNIEIGNKVEVTVVNGVRFDDLMIRYPNVDEALEVKVIQKSKLRGTELSKFEAIRKSVFSQVIGSNVE